MSEEEPVIHERSIGVIEEAPVCPFSEEGSRSGDILMLIMLVIVPLLLVLWLFSLG
ncbi:MAG: hypothetical protein ACTSV3_01960 [Candidatus Thorarchaeota archaeon]